MATPTQEIKVDLDPLELLQHRYRQEPHDPLRHPFVTQGIQEVLRLSEDFPDHFPEERAAEICASHLESTKGLLLLDQVPGDQQALWGRRLRARVLLGLERMCQDCRRCDLWKNTPQNQPEGETPLGVFGEGALDPLVMIVAESPGNFESRTGIPLIGNIELRASHCATSCTHFERCYTEPGNPKRFKRYLNDTGECHYEEITWKDREKLLPLRLARHTNILATTGELLDETLGEVGLIRSAPHALRQSLLHTNPQLDLPIFEKTNVYCTNAVRHRSAVDGKNTDPSTDQIKACNPWLEMTIRMVKPKTIVALGTPALKALGPSIDMRHFRITAHVPESVERPPESLTTRLHPRVYVCVHPSFIMRQDKERPGHKYREKLKQVLRTAKEEAQK